MNLGATKDYDFGPKNKWRREVWAEISRRMTPVSRRQSIVVYLAGEEDLDRRIAVSKGFGPENLIAVEKDESVAESLRKRGVNVIVGDLVDVLVGWSRKKPAGVVVADLCESLTWDVVRLFPASSMATGGNGVLALNIKRGREVGQFSKLARDFRRDNGFAFHRGAMALNLYLTKVHEAHRPTPWLNVTKDAYSRIMRPSYFDYTGEKTGFDSVVLNSLPGRWPGRLPPVDARVSAALAVSTMRKSGQLPKAPRR